MFFLIKLVSDFLNRFRLENHVKNPNNKIEEKESGDIRKKYEN